MNLHKKVILSLATGGLICVGAFVAISATQKTKQVNQIIQSDDFSSYPQGAEYKDNASFGKWNVLFTGYGKAKIVPNGGAGNALELAPIAHTGPTDTSSIMVVGSPVGDTFTYSGKISTEEQLRTGATPNAWETAWVVWNHTDNDHYYYFVARANGWELGKRDPKYTNGQRFMATGNESWPLASTKDFKISKKNNTIQVDINGQTIATVVDNENPYNSGRVGIYSEDARVLADDIVVDDTANITGTVNNGGIASIEGNPKIGSTLTAKINDQDGVKQITGYQWLLTGQDISGATNSTFVPTANEKGKAVAVRITYVDNTNKVESHISAPVQITDGTIQANNTGTVTIEGDPKVGSTLTAKVSDRDGLSSSKIQYTWTVGGQVVIGNTSANLPVIEDYLGKTVKVHAYYDDDAAHEENIDSTTVGPVAKGDQAISIPPATPGKDQKDNFENYTSGSTFNDGKKFADWELVYGNVSVASNGGNKTLNLSSKPGQDSASLMLGKTLDKDFTYSGTINSLTQLSATPKNWETEWIVWNYTDSNHFYYLAPRENGWVLAKRNGNPNNPEILATGTDAFPANSPKNFKIERKGNTFEVTVNGKKLASVTDNSPINQGRIGLYTYNSAINIDNIELVQKDQNQPVTPTPTPTPTPVTPTPVNPTPVAPTPTPVTPTPVNNSNTGTNNNSTNTGANTNVPAAPNAPQNTPAPANNAATSKADKNAENSNGAKHLSAPNTGVNGYIITTLCLLGAAGLTTLSIIIALKFEKAKININE